MARPRILLVLLFPAVILSGAWAGDWHTWGTLACSDCHTMHNSEGGQSMRYDLQTGPSGQALLRHATSTALCLYCHDGSRSDAPDVMAPVTYVADPAAGYFLNSDGIATGKGHMIGNPSPVRAPGGNDSFSMTCLTCHDPHGNANYRNLWPKTSGTGNASGVTVGVNQSVRADGTNPNQVYVPSNLVYKSGMSEWCNDCHNDFHGKSLGEEGTASPWFRHPQGQTLSTAPDADYSFWLQDPSGRIPAERRLPVQSPADNVVPSADDQVFCLSCHKAHGSSNRAGTIFADGATLRSTCQQCHNE